MHNFIPVGLHGKMRSVSWMSAGRPFGCSELPFLNCPLMNAAQVHGSISPFVAVLIALARSGAEGVGSVNFAASSGLKVN